MKTCARPKRSARCSPRRADAERSVAWWPAAIRCSPASLRGRGRALGHLAGEQRVGPGVARLLQMVGARAGDDREPADLLRSRSQELRLAAGCLPRPCQQLADRDSLVPEVGQEADRLAAVDGERLDRRVLRARARAARCSRAAGAHPAAGARRRARCRSVEQDPQAPRRAPRRSPRRRCPRTGRGGRAADRARSAAARSNSARLAETPLASLSIVAGPGTCRPLTQ